MSVQANYASVPVLITSTGSTANANRDGSGTVNTLVTARAPGLRIERVRAKALSTTTAGMIRIFHKGNGLNFTADSTGGLVVSSYSAATWRLIHELPVSAITPSGSIQSWMDEWVLPYGFNLGPFESLGWTTHNSDAFNVCAMGGSL